MGMKRVVVVLLLLFAGAISVAQTSVWDGSMALWTRGRGTRTSPFLIESASHLAFLAYMVNMGYETHGLYFRLTIDIDLNGDVNQPWTPIGLGDRLVNDAGCDTENQIPVIIYPHTAFRGHFDGDFHCISNIYIDNASDIYYPFVGLFGVVEGKTVGTIVEPAIIENVLVSSGYIFGDVCGGIVGNGSSSSLISRCWNGATIESRGNVCGGIVGMDGFQVNYCYNSGNVKGYYAGGIGGCVEHGAIEIQECYNEGDISGAFSGGIFGFSSHNAVAINNCYNTGRVTNETLDTDALMEGLSCGGIAGLIFQHGNSSVYNCYNVGDVFGSGNSGCILPYDSPSISFGNNYYIGTCISGGEGTAFKEDFMRTAEFVELLNDGNNDLVWGVDSNKTNDGFPVLVHDNFGAKVRNMPVLNIYPNPSKGKFYVEGVGYLTVTTILGQTVIAMKINGLQMITLPKGIYLITLKGITNKVVVE